MEHTARLGRTLLATWLLCSLGCSSENGSGGAGGSAGAGLGGGAGSSSGGAAGVASGGVSGVGGEGSGGAAGQAAGGAAGQSVGGSSSGGSGGSSGGGGGSGGSAAVCPVSSDDFPCTLCEKKNCCSELLAFGAAPDLTSFSACVKSCSSASCISACEAKYPTAGAAFEKMRACEAKECPASCGKTGTGQNDALRQWCKAATSSACSGGKTQSACEQDAVTNGKYYASSDCAPEHWNAFACGATKAVACGTSGPVPDPSCMAPLEACMNATTSCPWSPKPDGSCETVCPGWNAKCSPMDAGTSLTCSCTSGPHQGKAFQVSASCGSAAWSTAVEQQCAP